MAMSPQFRPCSTPNEDQGDSGVCRDQDEAVQPPSREPIRERLGSCPLPPQREHNAPKKPSLGRTKAPEVLLSSGIDSFPLRCHLLAPARPLPGTFLDGEHGTVDLCTSS